jgi:membrane protein DedA with SNARE-associated domain
VGIVDFAIEFMARHGYLVVLVAIAIDATAIPFPGRIVLVVAGALAARAELNLVLVILLGALGALIGDHLWYVAGRVKGESLVRRYCQLVNGRRCLERARESLRQYGPFAFVVGRFFAGVRIVAAPLAVSAGIRYREFLLYDAAGSLLWSALFVFAGWFLGEQARHVVERTGLAMTLGGLALAALAVTFVVARRWRRAS